MARHIDVHTHIIPKQLVGQIPSLGITSLQQDLYGLDMEGFHVAPVTAGAFEVETRLKEMASMKVDFQVLSPTFHLFAYIKEAAYASKVARAQNDVIASIAKTHSDKFIANATLPLQSAKDSLSELEYAVSKLEVRGIEIGTNVAGKNLDSPDLFPVFQRIEELDLPVFVHPNDIMAMPRFKQYYSHSMIGTQFETTSAFVSLIFGAILDKFPKLKFLFCHGGGAVPYQLGRIEKTANTKDEAKTIKKKVRDYLKNMYFDTVVFNQESLEFLTRIVTADNMLMGSDYPFALSEVDPVGFVESNVRDQSQRSMIMESNAKKLYKIT